MSKRHTSFRERWSDGAGTWGANPETIVSAQQELTHTHPRRRLTEDAITRLKQEAHTRRQR